MENANNWYFTKEQLANTPTRRSGIDTNKELSYRQQAANFIQDMGQRLQVSQLCINTAIVYMHRFYVFHSFTDIHRNNLSVAALFLAAKVEEQPRKLEHVIKIAHACLHKDAPPLDIRSEAYAEKQFEVVTNESILLQTLGFVLAIEHPHTYVVKLCQMVKESLLRKIECSDRHDSCKDLAQTSYFMATTSLHMTTMCLQYKPTVVAAVCIHLACKWSSWKIEPCSEGKEWYYYVDKSVSPETIEALTQEFVVMLESSPHRFKRKFIPQKTGEVSGNGHSSRNVLEDSSKHHPVDNKPLVKKEISSPGPSTSSSSASFTLNSQVVEKPPKVAIKVENSEKHLLPFQSVHSPLEASKKIKVSSHSISINTYREKKEKERLEHKIAPPPPVEPNVQQNVTNKPQLALNDHDKVHKHVPNSVESISHSSKEKTNKNVISQETLHQVHPVAVSKVNHHFPKKPDSLHSKESKSNLLKIPSNVSNDPVVVLERVDVKSEVRDSSIHEKSRASPCKLKNTQDNYSAAIDSVPDSKISVPVPPTMSPIAVSKSKHHKHKSNSLRSNHNSIHPHSQKPDKDIKTNGSKETEPSENKNSIVENSVISVKTPDKHEIRDKHEKREKYKSKHSSSSSRDKIVNSESLNPIKVKIRKEVINKLPEKSPKVQSSSSKEESPKTLLKIKLPKPPAPVTAAEPGTPSLKIVLTKDKSGSGAYCTSRKNDRESRKRAHSPSSRHESNYKGETPSKHLKLDHAHSSHSSAKQSKVRHSSSRHTDHIPNSVSSHKLNVGNESVDYHNVGVESYSDPAFCGNQYFERSPLPPPPPLPPLPNDTTVPGFKIKTNYSNYLSTQLPPHPE